MQKYEEKEKKSFTQHILKITDQKIQITHTKQFYALFFPVIDNRETA